MIIESDDLLDARNTIKFLLAIIYSYYYSRAIIYRLRDLEPGISLGECSLLVIFPMIVGWLFFNNIFIYLTIATFQAPIPLFIAALGFGGEFWKLIGLMLVYIPWGIYLLFFPGQSFKYKNNDLNVI